MPRAKAAPVAEPIEQTDDPPYHLEPMTEDLQMRLNVWGNSTVMLIDQITRDYPEWAHMIADMKQTIGIVIQGASE